MGSSPEAAFEKESANTTTFEAEFSNPVSDAGDGAGSGLTAVDASLFETPFKALGASGGTAAFFEVRYKDGKWKTDSCPGGSIDSQSYWIGKDLARARDEVDFYELVSLLRERAAAGWEIVNWMLSYRGVVTAPTSIGEREVLLLRNARDQYASCRLLDIKMGEVTAIGGWQGKGYFEAYMQSWIDGASNSAGEGFRLEGFDGMPTTLESVITHALTEENSPVAEATLERFLLQHMPAREFLRYFLGECC
jgi:hypothetical protein